MVHLAHLVEDVPLPVGCREKGHLISRDAVAGNGGQAALEHRLGRRGQLRAGVPAPLGEVGRGVLEALDRGYRGERYRVSPWLRRERWSTGPDRPGGPAS